MEKYGRSNILPFCYIVLMIIAFTTRFVDYYVDTKVQYLISIIIIFFSFIVYFKKEKKGFNQKLLREFFMYYFLPAIIIHMYSSILIFLGIMDKRYLCTNISTYIPIILAISAINFFGEKTIKYSAIALGCSWVISILISMIFKGVGIIPYAIMQGYFNKSIQVGNVTTNYFELHDIVLASGYLLVCYLFTRKKMYKKDFIPIIILFIIFFMGIKRIAVLGIIITYIFIKLTRNMSDRKKMNFIKISGITIFIISFIYIYLLYSGEFLNVLLNRFNINLKGRNYYYEAIIDCSELSMSYLGTGRNSVTKILKDKFSYLRVGGVHSDILKMYVENGFWIFSFWLYYFLIRLPKKLFKKCGVNVAYLYFCLTIYAFVLYYTDNTENYFICQFFYIVILVSYALRQVKERVKNEEKQKTING